MNIFDLYVGSTERYSKIIITKLTKNLLLMTTNI